MAHPGPLEKIALQVAEGQLPITTVRDLLSWFGASRRSWRNAKMIRESLAELKLFTVPDFEGEYIDADIQFFPLTKPIEEDDEPTEPVAVDLPAKITVVPPAIDAAPPVLNRQSLGDPAHRLSRLESANLAPTRVSPESSIEHAVTLMLQNDYSQLPVMTTEREVKGLLSWKSLGQHLAVGKQCKAVRDCMTEHKELASDASLFDAVRIIAEHDCVLVRDAKKVVCGIVTASDISLQFQQLAQPFLILGDIENHIRYLIGNAFSIKDLQSIRAPEDSERPINDVSDLTFGEYVRLLQNEENWSKLNIKIDRKAFTDELDKVRVIRNDVMHFDPDPMDRNDLSTLKKFSNFLSTLQKLTAVQTT
jgi:CBS domain-containing protein